MTHFLRWWVSLERHFQLCGLCPVLVSPVDSIRGVPSTWQLENYQLLYVGNYDISWEKCQLALRLSFPKASFIVLTMRSVKPFVLGWQGAEESCCITFIWRKVSNSYDTSCEPLLETIWVGRPCVASMVLTLMLLMTWCKLQAIFARRNIEFMKGPALEVATG